MSAIKDNHTVTRDEFIKAQATIERYNKEQAARILAETIQANKQLVGKCYVRKHAYHGSREYVKIIGLAPDRSEQAPGQLYYQRIEIEKYEPGPGRGLLMSFDKIEVRFQDNMNYSYFDKASWKEISIDEFNKVIDELTNEVRNPRLPKELEVE